MIGTIAAMVVAATPLADIGPAPEVKLMDSARKSFELKDLRGKVVLVSFVYTTCTGSCPATTLNLAQVQKALKGAGLWGEKVEFVSITLDPERDTPEALARYARLFGADTDHWHFLTGNPEEVKGVIASWDMWARVGPSGVLDHPSRIFLVDPRGREREIYNLQFLTPKSVLRDVREILGGGDAETP